MCSKYLFSNFSTKAYVVGIIQINDRLDETDLLSTKKHMLKPMVKKIYTILHFKILFIYYV